MAGVSWNVPPYRVAYRRGRPFEEALETITDAIYGYLEVLE